MIPLRWFADAAIKCYTRNDQSICCETPIGKWEIIHQQTSSLSTEIATKLLQILTGWLNSVKADNQRTRQSISCMFIGNNEKLKMFICLGEWSMCKNKNRNLPLAIYSWSLPPLLTVLQWHFFPFLPSHLSQKVFLQIFFSFSMTVEKLKRRLWSTHPTLVVPWTCIHSVNVT